MIYVFVISALSIQTLIQSQIDLGFHYIYLEITWKIHGILCHQRNENPVFLTHFKISEFSDVNQSIHKDRF